jgi:hypothetical protein
MKEAGCLKTGFDILVLSKTTIFAAGFHTNKK